jgi:hypothetical protein
MPLAVGASLGVAACVNQEGGEAKLASAHGDECYVPRLQEAAAASGITDANPCGPCGPCGPGAVIELEMDEAKAAYECIKDDLVAAYAVSGLEVATAYVNWDNYSAAPYLSALHGSRYVNNLGNDAAASYAEWEAGGPMVPGGILVKDSMTISTTGKVGVGPLFLMEKMEAGWYPDSDDWKYSLITANGSVMGETKGANSKAMNFCIDCHLAAERDHMFFLPEELRVNPN